MFKKILMISGIFMVGISSFSLLNKAIEVDTRVLNKDEEQNISTLKMVDLALVWANSLKTGDGKPRYEMMSNKAKEKFSPEQINRSGENWNYKIGVSSPWVVDFEIEIDGMVATIIYNTQKSNPTSYQIKEMIIFSRENGKLVVDNYLTIFDDKFIESMVDTEIHYIKDLIKKEKQTPAEVERILKSFRDLEPEYYDSIEGADFHEVVNWLYHIETPIKLNHIDDIFTLHDQIDGDASEMYSAIMYELFEDSPSLFVQSLSELKTEEIKHIVSIVAHPAGYFDIEEVVANTEHIFSSKELSAKEKSTVEEILNALDKQLNGEN